MCLIYGDHVLKPVIGQFVLNYKVCHRLLLIICNVCQLHVLLH